MWYRTPLYFDVILIEVKKLNNFLSDKFFGVNLSIENVDFNINIVNSYRY